MAQIKKISISYLEHYVSNYADISLTELEIYSKGIKQTISTITSVNGTIVNINNLLIPGNQTEVVIPSSVYWTNKNNFYIDITLENFIASDALIEVRFKSIILDKYIGSYILDIYLEYTNNSNNRWVRYNNKKFNVYPGDGNFNALEIKPSNYDNFTSSWDPVNKSINMTTDANGLALQSTYPASGSTYGNVRTKQGLSSGKWYIEKYDYFTSTAGTWGLCSSDFDITQNKWLGQDTEGQSFGFDYDSLYYKNSNAANIVRPLVEQLFTTINNPSLDYYNRVPFEVFLSSNLNYAICIDLDNRKLIVRNFNNTIVGIFVIPWSGPVYLCAGLGSVSYYSSGNGLGDINLGYMPLKGKPPEDYAVGYGEDLRFLTPVDSEIKNARLIEPAIPYIREFQAPQKVRSDNLISNTALNKTFKILTDEQVAKLSEALTFSFGKSEDLDQFVLTDYRGFGYIKSMVLKGQGTTTPIRTRVILLDIQTQITVASTYSDATTGQFEFKYISEWRDYNILAFDPQLGWVTAVGGPFKATRMPGTEGLVFNET